MPHISLIENGIAKTTVLSVRGRWYESVSTLGGERERMNQWLAERILTDGDVPWTTIPKALIEVGDLKRTASRDVLPQLREIERYLQGLAEAHTAAAVPAE
jgi:hypothetical protein